ncbi:hypothetical protein C8F01DRAFT_1237037 [Mycena amicta]|nr:hypothetical protein C8F01DRAFT_1237037 [Mycena amicta]
MTRSSELRSRIAEAETGIADLEGRLAPLRAYKTQLEDELRAIVNPILTIPAEITAEILCHAVAHASIKCILAVTSACAVWRSIALSTPRLWNASYRSAYSRPKDPVNLLNLWLSRSGSLPLSLAIHVSDDPNRILASMTRHISRWRRIDLHQQLCDHDDGSFGEGKEPSLAVHGNVPLASVDPDSCPKWRSVALCSTSVPPRALLPTLPNVASLTLSNVASAVVSMVLPHTPTLEVLTISGWQTEFLPSIHPPIILPLIHTLNHELARFLTRSGCALQMLHLEALALNGGLDVLRTVPSVLEFTGHIGDPEDYCQRQWDENEDVVVNRVLALLDAFAAGEILPAKSVNICI